jgi:uncharacterized protein YdaU (DUF1376 family)
MKLFWGDYHKATRHLKRDQHGAYFLLIGEAWRLGGALPDDDSLLAAWSLCTPEEWSEMKPVVMAFFSLRRGRWMHDRVRDELAVYEATSRKRKQAGKSGGIAKAGNATGNSLANAKQKPTKPEPEPEPESESQGRLPLTPKGERAVEGLVEKQFEAFWAAYPKKRAKADAQKAFLKALKRATVHDIAKGLKRDKISADWVKDDGKFIPYPASWLNAARWEDENVVPFHGAFVESQPDTSDPWPDRIREWQRSGDWKSGDWGPPPDSPKTEVAPRYLKDCLHSRPKLYDIAP